MQWYVDFIELSPTAIVKKQHNYKYKTDHIHEGKIKKYEHKQKIINNKKNSNTKNLKKLSKMK